MKRFNALLHAMVVNGSPPDRKTSNQADSGDCSDSQTPSRTFKGSTLKRGRASREQKA